MRTYANTANDQFILEFSTRFGAKYFCLKFIKSPSFLSVYSKYLFN